MSKRSKEVPLISEIGRELMPGHFFRRDQVSDLVTNLDGMHRKLEVLVKAERLSELRGRLRSNSFAGISA